MPESGGCERRRTDPFVQHLNDVEGSAYEHVVCLDRVIRDRPQPEALYEESSNGRRLVVERKNVVWPLDYVEQHQADHIVVDAISNALASKCTAAPYELRFRRGSSLNHEELRRFAAQVVEVIVPHVVSLKPEEAIRGGDAERAYLFRHQTADERDYHERSTGLEVTWQGAEPRELLQSPPLPEGLRAQIARCFASCVEKFAEYDVCRRILVVDQFGEIRFLGEWWWRDVLKCVPPPAELDDLWHGTHDYVTDLEEGWMFTKLFPFESEAR